MPQIITSIVSLLAQLLPTVAGKSILINNIISALVQLIPLITKEVQDVLPMVKNIIAVLKGGAGVTQAQLAQLNALDKQVDDAFEAAAAAALAQDAKPPAAALTP